MMILTDINKHTKNIFGSLFLLLIINGCTTIVDATTKKPLQPDPSQRSFGTYVDDKRLQVIVGVNIKKADSRLRQSSNINVTSFNGVILLTGQVPTLELKTLAGETSSNVNGVRQTHNEIQIKGNSPFIRSSNDAWLSTKVKTLLLSNNNVEGLKIKVIVEDAVAYLMGLVTQAEASAAANVASNISGIKEVVRVFEYTD